MRSPFRERDGGGVSLKGFLMTEEAQTIPQFREERTSRGIALAFRIGVN